MNDTAQIIVAAGLASMFVLLNVLGIIWSLRCDPKKSHYRLPALAAILAPIMAVIAAALKGH